jgi:hypothetical protein
MDDIKKAPKVVKGILAEPDEDEPMIEEEAPQGSFFEVMATKLIGELLSSKDNLKMKSDLTPAQIINVTRAYVYAHHYNNDLVKHVADTLLELLVSKGRLGRKELTELARSLTDYQRFDPVMPSRMDILTGKGL